MRIAVNIVEVVVSAVEGRSTFVTVLASVFIALSGFGTIISILQNVMIQTIFNRPEFNKTLRSLPPDAPPFAAFMMGHFQLFFLGFLLVSLFMLISSIGLLKRWNWARLSFVGLMLLAIIWQLVGLGMQFFFFSSLPEQFSAAATQSGPNMWPFVVAIGVMSALLGAGLCVLFGWIIKRLMSAPIAAEFH